jgi:hypothetical protein
LLHEGPEFQGSTGGRTQERLRARQPVWRRIASSSSPPSKWRFWAFGLRGGPLRRHVVAWVPRALERGRSSWNARLTGAPRLCGAASSWPLGAVHGPRGVAPTPKPPRAESLAQRVAWARSAAHGAAMWCGVRRAARTPHGTPARPGCACDRQGAMWLASARGPRGSYLSLHVRACPCM